MQIYLRTVQRVLYEEEKLVCGHLKVVSKSDAHHIRARKKWADNMGFFGPQKWRRTIFTDEKRFYCNGSGVSAQF